MKKNSFKTGLSLAALAGLTLFTTNPAQAVAVNPAEFLTQTTYGSGDSNLYYKFVNSDGGYQLAEVVNSEGADLTVGYNADQAYLTERIVNSGEYTSSDNIEGNFVGINGPDVWGGAIQNKSGQALGNISGDFIKNKIERDADSSIGSAIANGTGTGASTMGNVSGNFVGNSTINTASADDPKGYAHGTVNNHADSTMGDVSGNFIANYVESANSYARAAGVANNHIMNSVSGDFIGNRVVSTNDNAAGAAVYSVPNSQITEGITGNFIGNSASGKVNARGGAVAIGDNAVVGVNLSDNQSGIHDSKFYANYVESPNIARGGAIWNNGTITNGIVNSEFTANYAFTSENTEEGSNGGAAEGGAIYNAGTGNIDKINADFSQNYSASTSGSARGGAIMNLGTMSEITGAFTGNYVDGVKDSSGGAIYNTGSGTISSIKDSTFTGNYAKSAATPRGGGVYNAGTINEISNVKFEENGVNSTAISSAGGALYNYTGATIGDIKNVEFKNNTATASGSRAAYGGGLCNYRATINSIEASFTGNGIVSRADGYGGAIYNGGSGASIGSIKGNFDNNYASIAGNNTGGGAIFNNSGAAIGSIEGNFTNNYIGSDTVTTSGDGGAIANYDNSTIGIINGNFTNNHIIASARHTSTAITGGAISNASGSYIEGINGNFTGNYIESTANDYAHGGAIMNSSVNGIGYIKGDFENNHVYSKNDRAFGGAISNAILQNTEQIPLLGEVYGSFRNNYAKTDAEGVYATGGAIYNRGDIHFIADNTTNEFTGNYTEDTVQGKVNNGIFVRTNILLPDEDKVNQPTLTFDAKNGGSFVFDDNIDGGELSEDRKTLTREYQYNIVFKGDETGTVQVNNDIKNANITHEDVTTTVRDYQFLNHAAGEGINSLTMNSGTLNLGSMTLAPLHFETFAMNGGTINLDNVQVDLQNRTMSRITANNYKDATGGTINVKSMTLLNDSDDDITPVKFADKSFKNTVTTDVKKAYGSIYEYDVEYDTEKTYEEEGQKDDDGYFVFLKDTVDDDDDADNDTDIDNDNDNDDDDDTPIRPTPVPGPSPQPDIKYNPAILVTPVAMQAAANGIMGNTLQYAFEHAHYHMMSPAMDRLAIERANRYALSSDYNNNMDYTSATQFNENKAIWLKPYTSFEKMDLKGGPKVDMITYGMLVGGDSDFRQLKNGWGNVGTLYLGYTGAQLDYQDIDISMNGGVLGLTETFYKKNFFNATTISAGATFAEAQTMFGKDDMTMIMAGIANKTGYNWEFKEGRFIIQPNLILSYTMVNNFDYTNKAGVKIKSDPLHSIGINPNIRFIANTKRGWQPYASVGMVWNVMNETDVKANAVKLPEMHTKPYIQYGVGLQKHIGDRFAGYAQAMVRNGGRNGIAFTLGFRWALGKHDEDYNKNVNVPSKTVKSIAGQKSAVSSTGSVYSNETKNIIKSNDLRYRPSAPQISFDESGLAPIPAKTVVKSLNSGTKSKNIARYNDIIGG